MSTQSLNPIKNLAAQAQRQRADQERRARAERPEYFAAIDALLASGDFSVADDRATSKTSRRR